MLPGRVYTPALLGRLAWQRKWLIVLPALLGLAAAAFYASRLRDQFQAETLILVVPQRVPETYVRSTVTMRIEDRLRTISQQILSRTRLEQIIEDFNLYPELRANVPLDDVVALMRDSVDLAIVRGDSFRLAYTYSDPKATMQVTDRLARDFISDNSRERRAQAESTNQFLEAQLGDARKRLIEQEKRLEEYRRLHAGSLPTQLQSNLQIIQNIQTQLQRLNEGLNRHRDRRLVVERLLSDLAIAESLPPAIPVNATTAAQLPVEGQLTLARQRLTELQARGLTSAHPDLRAAERKVGELEQALAEERRKQPAAAVPDTRIVDAGRRNQAVQLTAERDNLDRQIAAAVAEEGRLQASIAQYQARIEEVPKRESELTELTRDYDTLQTAYRALLAKKEESQIATNLENRQIGEQFRMIDAARVPESPISPNRPLVHVFGAIAGLVVGLALVGLLEVRDSSLKTETDVVQVLELPVLAMVPVMNTFTVTPPRRSMRMMLFAIGVIVLLAAGAGVAFWKGGF